MSEPREWTIENERIQTDDDGHHFELFQVAQGLCIGRHESVPVVEKSALDKANARIVALREGLTQMCDEIGLPKDMCTCCDVLAADDNANNDEGSADFKNDQILRDHMRSKID